MAMDFSDPEFIFEQMGVTKLPRPLNAPDPREHYPREYLGTGKSSPVLVRFDVSAAGEVERVEAIVPPYLLRKVNLRAVLIGPDGKEKAGFEPARELDPLFARAAEASVRSMRFSPAELNGEAVPFRGFRMTIVISEPKGEADATGR